MQLFGQAFILFTFTFTFTFSLFSTGVLFSGKRLDIYIALATRVRSSLGALHLHAFFIKSQILLLHFLHEEFQLFDRNSTRNLVSNGLN